MKNILIRTLGGGNIGYGHFFRCLSLYKAISKTIFKARVMFLINENLIDLVEQENIEYIVCNDLEKDIDAIGDLTIDLFILDTYLGNDEYLHMIKKRLKSKIMLIDDNNDIYDSTIVDIIYNGNIHAESLNYRYVEGQLRLLGVKYLIMKGEYWHSEDSNMKKNGILITTGGSDEHEIAIEIMNSLKNLNIQIKMIIGPGYEDDYVKKIESEGNSNIQFIYSPSSLKEYIDNSKIVITAGGSTIYEVISQQSIPIIFSLADNQDLICDCLNRIGVSYLGKYPEIDYFKLESMIEAIYKDKRSYKDVFNLVDGKGALKVAELVLSIYYRPLSVYFSGVIPNRP